MALAVVVVVALGAVAAVVVMRSDDEPAGPPAGLTVDDLRPALLTVDDVGPDYHAPDPGADSGGGDDGDIFEDDSTTMSDDCRAAWDDIDGGGAGSQDITATFENDIDATIEHSIGLAAVDGASLADVRDALDRCDVIEFEQDGAAGRATSTTHTVSGLGDEAMEWILDMEVEAQGLTIAFGLYVLAWEHDGVQSTITALPGFDDSTLAVVPVDRGKVLDLATMADQRVADVLAGF